MKKRILLAVLFGCLVTGCSSGKKLECVHKDKNANMSVTTTQKFIFDKEGKKINEASTKIEYIFTDQYLKYLEDNKIDMKDSINTNSICDSYKGIDNASCKTSIKDNKITIEAKIKESKNTKKTFDGDYNFFKKYYEGIKYECK